jgi:hypothetical protein
MPTETNLHPSTQRIIDKYLSKEQIEVQIEMFHQIKAYVAGEILRHQKDHDDKSSELQSIYERINNTQ